MLNKGLEPFISRIMRASWRLFRNKWTVVTQMPLKKMIQRRKVRQHLDTTTVHLLVFNTHFYTRMFYLLLADSSVDRKGKRAGRVELQEVEVLPVHLPAGLVVGKCHLP